ncbi:MAG: siderophore-interacting protein [Caldilineaceae bacterium SB0661_bin_32]|uniref:Siderophore-interacting protein n=1 Tax=Caldilineaceae bacterium SB0661_bin_32 TaxID=2605255 RepID=A0A6B1D7B6_9CHLR|nr:siderophore-interacting protein [Caldilineaceae bacterium SB0661_bin_32]
MSEHLHKRPHRLPPRYPVTIRRLQWLTPRVANLVLHGPELSGFEPADPGSHIKLILPPPGVTDTPQPLRHEGRRPVFAEGVTPPFLRTYTPLRYNAETLELEVEMLLHGDSPASNWLRSARPGHNIIAAGPRGGWVPPQDGDWYVVLADDTGIPAAVQVLQALPDRPVTALFEVVDERERRPLPAVPDDLPCWLYREPQGLTAGVPLEQAVRESQLPAGRGYVWMALEAGAMRRIRRHLIEDRGLLPECMVTRGYWKLGTSDHPDGDYGTE